MTSSSPYFLRTLPYVDGTPFKGDQLNRLALAEHLTKYVEVMKEGCVIGITADWGNGKTWFAQNWRAQLATPDENGAAHKTFYLDAFANDFSEDAFMVIAAEIMRGTLVDENTKSKLLKSATSVALSLLPMAATLATSAALKFATGMTSEDIQEIGEKMADNSAEAAKKGVEKRLKEWEKSHAGTAHFKKQLAEFCESQSKPVVFFIDELDRCRPSFAVQVVERIKHFFDVPNLIFVIMLNRQQLEESICGIYGQGVDANIYLSKFVQFFWSLPNGADNQTTPSHFLLQYCNTVGARYGFNNTNANAFYFVLSEVGSVMGLTLRDCERAVMLRSVAKDLGDCDTLAAYIIAVKLRRRDLFEMLKHPTSENHKALLAHTAVLLNRDPSNRILPAIWALHNILSRKEGQAPQSEIDTMDKVFRLSPGSSIQQTIQWVIGKLDMPLPAIG